MRRLPLAVLAVVVAGCCGCVAGLGARPTSVRATWRPGLNAGDRREQTTDGSAALARRLVADVQSAPAFPAGRIACPADFGVAVVLVFGYPQGAERVRVTLTGCAAIRTPGERVRLVSDKFRRDLRPLAPPAFRNYLGG